MAIYLLQSFTVYGKMFVTAGLCKQAPARRGTSWERRGEPRRAQDARTPRRAQDAPGAPRSAHESPEDLKSAQERRGTPNNVAAM